MIPPIAKKYVKALFESADEKSIKEYYDKLESLNSAYSLEKVKNILLSPSITKSQKVDFVLSLVEDSDDKFSNFIKILVLNDRMNLLPAICDELRYELSVKENRFVGHIVSSSKVDENSKKSIEEKLSKKFNSQIILETVEADYPGVKIEIEDLGVEISFSIDRLKAQMTEHILKAI